MAPQWKCVSSRFKAYQSADCNFTQKTECRLGCEDGACRLAPICERKFKCKTKNVKALQTENCLWVGEVKCKAGCVEGKCNPESEINGAENLTEEIDEVADDEIVEEKVATEPAEEIFRLNFAEEATIKLNGVDYVIQVYNIESGRVKLKVNGVASNWIYEGDNVMMAEGNVLIVVKEVLFQAYFGGKQEVLNYLQVLTNIEKYHEEGRITEKLLLKLHKDVAKETLENPQHEGIYRKVQVYVGNKITGEVVFMPPKVEEVQTLVQNLLEWINQEKELNPVLLAGLAHYEFVRIHPFVDGNGRTARALATLSLYTRDFDIKRFFALDDYYDSDRNAYYTALKSVDKNTLDTTHWTEYFTDGVLISLTRVKEKILSFSIKRTGPQIALTEKQMKIMEKVVANGRITSGEIQESLKLAAKLSIKNSRKCSN